jgi:transcriptional regulator with XRE-family HTH domain
MTQTALAVAVGIDRTTLNHIERERRSDVSISQLFKFAEALRTEPVYLLSPRLDDARIEITAGGRTLTPRETRRWVRGEPPVEVSAERSLDWFLALPRDEQLELLGDMAASGLTPLGAELTAPDRAARVGAAMEALDQAIADRQERGAAPRKLRARKEE